MTPMQQILLGSGGAKVDPIYVDNLFSTYLFKGNGSYPRTITNGIDFSGEDGLVIHKSRSDDYGWVAYDTIRGAGAKALRIDGYQGENSSNVAPYALLDQFNNNGFRLNQPTSTDVLNGNNLETASFSFRKASGFLDIVSYSGDGTTTGRAINHGLKSKPGFIIVKRLDSGGSNAYRQWFCYHEALPDTYQIKLSSSDPKQTNGNDVFGTGSSFVRPTSTQFTVGEFINYSGGSYVAYLFGGGESDASEAVSVDFDDDDGLDVAASSDFNFGTGQFCIECWVYVDDLPSTGSPSYGRVFQQDGPTGNSSFSNLQVTINPGDGTLHAWAYGGGNPVGIVGSKNLKNGQWHHIAVNRDSNNVITQYVDGIPDGTVTTNTNFNPNSGSPRPRIGSYDNGGTNGVFNGKISNLRVTVGEPVYTSAFKPSTNPLTTSSQGVTASNVKLLCCNNSSTTGSTTTSGTITANSDPTASTDSPFDDPAGFKFGDAGDQNVIKTGSYTKTDTGSSNTLHIELGWEPQLILQKRTDGSGDWYLMDVMREMSTGLTEILRPNSSGSEVDYGGTIVVPTATGFTVKDNNSDSYIFLAIRRSDGYVGKPRTATELFAMDTGNSSANGPAFDSNFAVDFTFSKEPASTGYWITTARLMHNWLRLNDTNAEASLSSYERYDFSKGVHQQYNSSNQAWMFKRGAGMDVVAYGPGNEVEGRQIPHQLNKIPEMIWIKNRDSTDHWVVYHKGLNGGTNPEQYYLWLDSNNPEDSTQVYWNNTAPTSTHFTVGNGNAVNQNNKNYIAMLFASVDGISKVDYYDGTGSSLEISCGFQPRIIVIKPVYRPDTYGGAWHMFDTLRGINSGNEYPLRLNTDEPQTAMNHLDYIDLDSDGFTIVSTHQNYNYSGARYIYFAHA